MTMPAPLQKRSTITRNWKTTGISLLLAIVCAAACVGLFMTIVEGPITAGIACIPGILALIFGWSAIGGSAQCTCPDCGKLRTGLSTGSNDGIFCEGCKNYFEGKNGELWRTDESRVADSPTFKTTLPEKFQFPEGCCVCGQPETQRQKISMSRTNASSVVTQSTVGLTTRTVTSVEVPHCASHKDGAFLGGTSDKPYIHFRSLPYLRAFCKINSTEPS